MALVLQPSIAIKQRVQAFPALSARLMVLVNAYLNLLTQFNGDPLLAFVPFHLDAEAAVVVADVPVRLYAVVAFSRVEDDFLSVTVQDDALDTVVSFEGDDDPGAIVEGVGLYPDGLQPASPGSLTVAAGGAVELHGFVLLGAA